MKKLVLACLVFSATYLNAQNKVYEGDVYQAGVDETYKAVLTITKDNQYKIDYPDSKCSGVLKFVEEDNLGFLKFQENITKGKEFCVNGLNVYLYYMDADKTQVNFKAEATEAEDDEMRTIGDLYLKQD